MKKCLIILAVIALVSFSSCKKTRYCKCTCIIDEEVTELGEDYYLIEDGRETCAEKAKELIGWGQVTCTEYSESEVTGEESNWWEDLFGGN